MGIIKTEILSVGNYLLNSKLHIPTFQRPYKWSTNNVVQLLEDIQRFKGTKSYRIGTIVIHQENNICNIVDGQQRTISFLLMVKSFVSERLNVIQNESLRQLLQNIQAQNFKHSFKSQITQKNIQLNYREIERRVATIDEDFIDFFLNKCEITYFVIDDISEAFQFFDSQNSRGKDLEPHDLLKAFHLRELKADENTVTDKEEKELVETWEDMDSEQLSKLFADFLYRVKGWSKGESSRYFSKMDIHMFKGINLSKTEEYPYAKLYRLADAQLKLVNSNSIYTGFPFQLDQIIINGKYFFEMVSHYKNLYEHIQKLIPNLTSNAQTIMNTIDDYGGMHRTGDKYVRMLFNCSLLYYIDKFGFSDISKAIEKLFIWAYSIRLSYQNLQLASLDNYVINGINIFKKIRDAVFKDEILSLVIPSIEEEYKSDKTEKIRQLFLQMKYISNE